MTWPGRMMLSDHAATSNHWRIWLGRRHPTGNRAIIICYVLFGDPFINGHRRRKPWSFHPDHGCKSLPRVPVDLAAVRLVSYLS